MKTLILFAHPRLEKSKINKLLLSRIKPSSHLSFVDLYETYPDFNIDIEKEKELLLQHDVIIWQHPFYWYSCPPLLKQWIDLVLEFEWAYGPGGNALRGKYIFNSITTGGAAEAYQHEGKNRFTVREYLHPFDQTALLCNMHYLPPFAVQGTHRLSNEKLNAYADQYAQLLELLVNDGIDLEAAKNAVFLNDILAPINQ
ncbi:MAG TPA: NAD(P)H-dependent oxidoreductase [Chitinophagaceae bacterium]|nr:NAD(P)H-dependent oxidoreductase [Chitinophagaceae bacterium]